MATKADFTSEEWWRLTEAPLAVAMYVSGADPRTGPIGTIKELSAPFKAAKSQEKNAGGTALLGELLLAWSTKLNDDSKKAEAEGDAGKSGESVSGGSVDLLGFISGVGQLLDAKAPADAASIKAWLVAAAHLTAEAGKEGATLGLGGEKVSAEESKAIAEVAKALGSTA
jgi:hypothetical protein